MSEEKPKPNPEWLEPICQHAPETCRIIQSILEGRPIAIPESHREIVESIPREAFVSLEEQVRAIRAEQAMMVADFLRDRGLHEYAVLGYQTAQRLADQQSKILGNVGTMRLMRDAIRGKERSLSYLGRVSEAQSANATAAFLTRIIDAPGL